MDLAGSERVKKSKTAGRILKEGTSINKSLFALGKVIKSIVDSSSSYVPYRDSTLTWILKNDLGGNCVTHMIANISSDVQHVEETLNTIRFANKVKEIVSHPSIQEDPHKKTVHKLNSEIFRLKNILKSKDFPNISIRLKNSKGTLEFSLGVDQIILGSNPSLDQRVPELDDFHLKIRMVSVEKLEICPFSKSKVSVHGIPIDNWTQVSMVFFFDYRETRYSWETMWRCVFRQITQEMT